MIARVERLVSRWGEHGPRPEPLAANGELFAGLQVRESVEVACAAEDAWRLVSNVTRIGEFSPECINAHWLDDASGLQVGARFEGTNRVVDGDTEVIWIRPCTLIDVKPGELFAYTVGDRFDGTPASSWEFVIDSLAPGRCRITQTFRHKRDGLTGFRCHADSQPDRARQIVSDRLTVLRAGMQETLLRMRAQLESMAGTSS
jgi:uncharacterized protein YndB with AHSA1/START domain